MSKLIESTFVSLDGVISNPHHWSPPYWDEQHSAYAQKLFEPADAMLLGRATYEGFAQAWPSRSGDPFTDRFNAIPKHVASRTLTNADMTWNASLIEGDAAEGVAKLKADGQHLVKYGTGSFDKTLLEHKLVDEYHLWTFPVVVGSGDRLFDGFDTTHLELVDVDRFKSGIVVSVFAPKSE
jgi:dihydrofolate reductase